jgi:hypothetical protein
VAGVIKATGEMLNHPCLDQTTKQLSERRQRYGTVLRRSVPTYLDECNECDRTAEVGRWRWSCLTRPAQKTIVSELKSRSSRGAQRMLQSMVEMAIGGNRSRARHELYHPQVPPAGA